jgi:phosphatidylglycerophosphate synthase
MSVSERRPIASRNWRVSKNCAQWLARRGVSPNAISIFGMLAALLAGCAFVATRSAELATAGFLVGALLIQVRLLCNMFDGMVALEQQRNSPLGALYNEVPDRVSDAAVLVGAGYAAGGDTMLGLIATAMAIFVAYVRAAGSVAGAPQEFCGPMAKPHRMATITLAAIYAGLVPASFQPSFEIVPGRGMMTAALGLVIVGGTLTVVRRLNKIAVALRSHAS